MTNRIKYIKCGGSYQLVEPYTIQTKFRPGEKVLTARLLLDKKGNLTISDGYCWDGTSGPVIDRRTNMRAGLVHDALYEMMRKGLIPCEQWRDADREFARILAKDGAWKITIKIDLAGLKLAGGKYAKPEYRKKRYMAP